LHRELAIPQPDVERAFFPLTKILELGIGSWSRDVMRLAVWGAGQVSFVQAEARLGEIGQIHISDSSIWRAVEQWGRALQECEAQVIAAANTPLAANNLRWVSTTHAAPGVSLAGWFMCAGRAGKRSRPG
jgi:hypothetical protein